MMQPNMFNPGKPDPMMTNYQGFGGQNGGIVPPQMGHAEQMPQGPNQGQWQGFDGFGGGFGGGQWAKRQGFGGFGQGQGNALGFGVGQGQGQWMGGQGFGGWPGGGR